MWLTCICMTLRCRNKRNYLRWTILIPNSVVLVCILRRFHDKVSARRPSSHLCLEVRLGEMFVWCFDNTKVFWPKHFFDTNSSFRTREPRVPLEKVPDSSIWFLSTVSCVPWHPEDTCRSGAVRRKNIYLSLIVYLLGSPREWSVHSHLLMQQILIQFQDFLVSSKWN